MPARSAELRQCKFLHVMASQEEPTQSMEDPNNMLPLAGGSTHIRSPWLVSLELRASCFLLLVTANVVCFRKSLVFVLTSALENAYSQHYSHIVLIPFLCLYLLYLQRAAIFATAQWSPFLGSILMMIGGAGAFYTRGYLGVTLDSFFLSILSLVMTWWGAFLFCFGAGALRTAFFGLGLLTFMVPLPSFVLDSVAAFLQRSSAEVTALLFSVLHVPVLREGFVFSLSDFAIYVAEECSGIRSFFALVITSLVAGHWFLTSGLAKTALVVVVVPLAIIKNAFRIVGLALLANYVDPTFITDSALHRSGGIPLFLLSLVVLFGIVLILRRWESRLSARGGSVRDDHA